MISSLNCNVLSFSNPRSLPNPCCEENKIDDITSASRNMYRDYPSLITVPMQQLSDTYLNYRRDVITSRGFYSFEVLFAAACI